MRVSIRIFSLGTRFIDESSKSTRFSLTKMWTGVINQIVCYKFQDQKSSF